MKYFTTYNGEQIELKNVGHDGSNSTKARHFVGFAADGTKHHAERKVEFKSNPSLHKCGPRCQNATGFQCECACGGRNHGAGNFTATEVAPNMARK